MFLLCTAWLYSTDFNILHSVLREGKMFSYIYPHSCFSCFEFPSCIISFQAKGTTLPFLQCGFTGESVLLVFFHLQMPVLPSFLKCIFAENSILSVFFFFLTSQACNFLIYKICKVAQVSIFVHFWRPGFLRFAVQVTHLLMKRWERRSR